jgi:drug/metabolite transporter superfamily protein YnfA
MLVVYASICRVCGPHLLAGYYHDTKDTLLLKKGILLLNKFTYLKTLTTEELYYRSTFTYRY